MNAIDLPSGDHAKLPTPSSIDVSLRAFAAARIDQVNLPLVVAVRDEREPRSVGRPGRRRCSTSSRWSAAASPDRARRRARSRCGSVLVPVRLAHGVGDPAPSGEIVGDPARLSEISSSIVGPAAESSGTRASARRPRGRQAHEDHGVRGATFVDGCAYFTGVWRGTRP